MSHTPGPLKAIGHIIYNPKGKYCKNPADHIGGKVAVVEGWGNSNHEQQDDYARLFAAAPELLEALEAVISAREFDLRPEHCCGPTLTDAMQQARAAIAKAKGG